VCKISDPCLHNHAWTCPKFYNLKEWSQKACVVVFQEGDIVVVTKMFANGQWHGECRGKEGLFPNRYVKFLDDM
jgi:hypothetical protein